MAVQMRHRFAAIRTIIKNQPVARSRQAQFFRHLLGDLDRKIVELLSRDAELSVAGPLLQYSPLLQDEDLLDLVIDDHPDEVVLIGEVAGERAIIGGRGVFGRGRGAEHGERIAGLLGWSGRAAGTAAGRSAGTARGRGVSGAVG